MKYLSVCSGIEAATVAWHPLGWKPVAFSEIEPFPCKVLAHHYPDVPNFGDMTKFKEWPDANVDVLVGGTPCQSFSIAGLRKGLDDPRGNLMLTYLAIAAKYRPKWVLWENVAGVLSSNGGRDFATFLRGLAECGYGYAYRVLDAQYVRTDGYPYAVPQRRRRVFVVGCIGNWRSAAAVLFDSESMSGNPAPSRKKGQEVTPTIRAGASNGGRTTLNCNHEAPIVMTQYGEVAGSLTARHDSSPCADRGQNIVAFTNRMVAFGEYVDDDTAGSLKQRDYKDATDLISYGIPGNWIGRKPENGGNAVEPMLNVAPCQTKTDRHAVAFNWQGSAQQGASVSENVTPTLEKSKVHAVAYPINTQLATRGPDTSNSNREGVGLGNNGDPAFTLQAAHHHAVAYGVSEKPDVAIPINTQMQVRRLTPLECHRLQGFPDHYLHQVKGATDSAMYKALGNSMAVNCMSLLGQRIQMVQDIQRDREAA